MNPPERPANAASLQRRLEDLILSGRIAPGQPLPSIRQLARDAGVAPSTVAKVYRSLREAGLVVAASRSVTSVASTVSAPPAALVSLIERTIETAHRTGTSLPDVQRLLATMWTEAEK